MLDHIFDPVSKDERSKRFDGGAFVLGADGKHDEPVCHVPA